MRFIYFTLFLFILSCGTAKKEFVCGDHLCKNKKEFKEYFSNNLIIEIEPKNKRKNENIDLVKINTEIDLKKKILK